MASVEQAVLAANQAFYDAFRERRADALDRLWAREFEVAVIHPGWPVLYGRDAVMESWRSILEGPSPPEILCDDARAHVHGGMAFVVCTEHLTEGDLVATNVFVREGDAWKLAHHHAGPAPQVVGEADAGALH